MTNEITTRIRDLVVQIKLITPHSAPQVALVGLSLGAVYALREAVSGGCTEKPSSGGITIEKKFLNKFAESLSSNEVPPEDRTRFYFNSALIRIAILGEQIDTYQRVKTDDARKVRREVNRIKHSLVGIVNDRAVCVFRRT